MRTRTLTTIAAAPLPETADKVYDYLDTLRGVDAFLKGRFMLQTRPLGFAYKING